MATASSPAEAEIGVGPEAELLLCCTRSLFDAGNRGRVGELLRRELNWEFIVASALKHGVATLLYENLRGFDSAGVPPSVLDTLGNWFREMTARNELLLCELAELLRDLRASGITAIPFKGPVLAIGAYGNLSLRTFTDLDLLVHRRNIAAAKDVLFSRGYRPKKGEASGPADDNQPYGVFLRGDGKVQVDLQSSIEDANFSFSLDRDEWLQECEPVSYRQLTFSTMKPDVTLLILCVHGCKHLWERLIWISDVAELVRSHPDLDWNRLQKRAGMLHCRRMLDTGLTLAGGLLGERCAREAIQRLGTDWDVQSLATRLAGRVFRESNARTSPAVRAAFYLQMQDRWLDRTRYALRIGIELHPERSLWFTLPPHIVLLCYVMRSLRFLGRHLITTGPLMQLKRAVLRWIERTR